MHALLSFRVASASTPNVVCTCVLGLPFSQRWLPWLALLAQSGSAVGRPLICSSETTLERDPPV